MATHGLRCDSNKKKNTMGSEEKKIF